MTTHTPTPWHWGNVYDDGSGPSALRGPKNEAVALPYLDWSLEPGEGLDEWGIDISDEDAEFITRACNMHDELCEAVDAALGHVRGEGPPNWDWLRDVLNRAKGG